MTDDARFRKGFLLALVVAITATFVFVIRDFLMTIFVAAIFSGVAHPLYSGLRKTLGGREALFERGRIVSRVGAGLQRDDLDVEALAGGELHPA